MQFLQRGNAARSQVVPGFYHLHPGYVFLPGAGNAVFEPTFQLPIIQLIGSGIYAGPAPGLVHQRPLLMVTQNPQVAIGQAVPVAGIGGVIAGQWINQPLNVPDTTNGSQ